MSLQVEVTDRETGHTDSAVVADNDYLILCVGDCYLDGIQTYPATGTHVLTVKNCRPRPVENPPSVPAHLEPIWTDRGFKRMPTLRPSAWESVQVSESSAAESPRLWLTVERSEDEATVSLALEDAAKLRDQLDFLIRNHYQLETL